MQAHASFFSGFHFRSRILPLQAYIFMTLTFEQQPDDLYAFYLFEEWEAPHNKWKRWKMTVLPALSAFLLMLWVARHHGVFHDELRGMAFAFLLLFSAVVIYAITPGWKRYQVRQMVAKRVEANRRSGMLGVKTLDLNSDSLTLRTEATETVYHSLYNLQQNSLYYFIYVSETKVIILPKGILQEEEREEFLVLIKGLLMKL